MSFRNTPTGKIVDVVIHDINGPLGSIVGHMDRIEERIKDGNPLTNEEMLSSIELIRKRIKRINEANDYLYEKLKELQENGDQPRTAK